VKEGAKTVATQQTNQNNRNSNDRVTGLENLGASDTLGQPTHPSLLPQDAVA